MRRARLAALTLFTAGLTGCAGLDGDAPVPTAATATAKRHPDGLPPAFLRRWVGVGQTVKPGRSGPAFAVELHIEPRDRPDRGYRFEIIYGSGARRQVRPYLLLPTERPGEFDLDENNGIVLRATLIGDTLFCPFTVAGKELVSRYTLRDDHLEVEHLTFSHENPRSSTAKGGGPGVEAYQVLSVQRALLRPR